MTSTRKLSGKHIILLVSLQNYEVREVPDVMRNGYCFSDGVGRISLDMCEKVAERLIKLGRCPPSFVPSAYQIRFAGCKGMVSQHPDLRGMRCALLLLAHQSPISFTPLLIWDGIHALHRHQ